MRKSVAVEGGGQKTRSKDREIERHRINNEFVDLCSGSRITNHKQINIIQWKQKINGDFFFLHFFSFNVICYVCAAEVLVDDDADVDGGGCSNEK